MKHENQYTGTFENLEDLLESAKNLRPDLESLEIQSSVRSYFSPSSIKITFDDEDSIKNVQEIIRKIVTKALEEDREDDPIDEFRLWSYFGDTPKKNDSCYITLYNEGRRQFGRDMSAGKYGSLD